MNHHGKMKTYQKYRNEGISFTLKFFFGGGGMYLQINITHTEIN